MLDFEHLRLYKAAKSKIRSFLTHLDTQMNGEEDKSADDGVLPSYLIRPLNEKKGTSSSNNNNGLVKESSIKIGLKSLIQ